MTTQQVSVGGQTIDAGQKQTFRFAYSETYHGDTLEIPVTAINGESESPSPSVFLTAAVTVTSSTASKSSRRSQITTSPRISTGRSSASTC